MIRKHIYKWHRITSVIIAIPVLLWAISGFMHPMMTTIKPRMATQVLQPVAIDSAALKIDLPTVLEQNDIDVVHNVRLIHIDTNWFYQVQIRNGEPPAYLSTINGKSLRNGDQLYAQYIAKQFLEGQAKSDRPESVNRYGNPLPETINSPATITTSLNNNIANTSIQSDQDQGGHDCCDAATSCVLTDTAGSLVASVKMITSFDKEYKYINRLLPVYKVQFDRADSIRVYVETTQDRFAFAMDNRRAAFDSFFAFFHTWDWLSFTGKFRHLFVGLLCLLAFFSSVMGLYIFFITKAKKGNQPATKARRRHRFTAVLSATFTLMFTFSGAFHSLDKLRSPSIVSDNQHLNIARKDIQFDLHKISTKLTNENICGISIARIDTNLYWRILTDTKNIHYFNTNDHNILPNGEEQHALFLAASFSGHPVRDVTNIEQIRKFAGEYGFVNKRLPVWKLSYASNSNERYYVETGTGKCAAHFTDRDLFEGYSFALLHKHHFMDWAGKSARDISTMIAAGLQIIMVLFGLYLFYRWMRK